MPPPIDRNVLRNVFLFKDLSDPDLDQVAGIAKIEGHKAQETIFKEGAPGDKFYIVLEGAIRISKFIGSSEEALSVLKAGEFFGEMSLIEDLARSADAIAHEDARLLVLEKGDFENLLFLNKDLAYTVLWAFTRTLSKRLREMNEKVGSLLAMKGGF